MHPESYALMSRFAATVKPGASVLDVGSRDVNGTYRGLFPGRVYTGIDIEAGPGVDLVVSGWTWPELQEMLFDAVISGQCLEHTTQPWTVMEAIASRLLPGGRACVIVPSTGPEHRYPIDCYRFMPDGLRALGDWAGLRVVEIVKGPKSTPVDWGDIMAVYEHGG